MLWSDSRVNIISKLFQSLNMHLDVAVNLIQKSKDNMISYRTKSFFDAQNSAKICEQMNSESVVKEKRLKFTQKEFCL